MHVTGPKRLTARRRPGARPIAATGSGVGAVLLAGLLAASGGGGGGGGGGSGGGPFETAALVPEDVCLYLNVRDAAALRAELAQRPIARLVARVLEGGALPDAWRRAADAAGVDGVTLFDTWLGRRCTLVLRHDSDRTDWALLTEVDAAAAKAILDRLEPVDLTPRGERAIARLPEHELRLAQDGSRYLIGPERPGALFDEILAVIDPGLAPPAGAGGAAKHRLADDPALAKARSLGNGTAGVFIRHGPAQAGGWGGGWSAIVASVCDGRVRLRHVARFESPPFGRDVTELSWDASALAAFEDDSLVTVMEPADVGDGPVASFAEAVLREPLLSREMRANLGDCRILCVGDEEGRLAPEPADLLLPAGAIAIKIKDPVIGAAQLDHQVIRLLRALNALVGEDARIPVPAEGAFAAGVPRHVELGPALRAFAPDLPLLATTSLNWTVASGPCGDYWVLATHANQLARTVRALSRDPGPVRQTGRWASCGAINGPRVGLHLRTYGDQAAALAAGNAEEFRETMLVLSELAAGIDRCRWRLRRPTREEMDLDVEVLLRPAESAEGGNPASPEATPTAPCRSR